MNEWYYFMNGDKLTRLKVEQDDDPYETPRDWDGNVGHMMCWYKGYVLGDKHKYSEPEDFLNNLIRENYSWKQLVSYVRSGKVSNNLEINYDRKSQVYELYGDYRVWWNGSKIHHGVLNYQSEISWLEDDIIDALPISDKIKMLERKGYFFMGISVYEHGGITMYIGKPSDHFDGQWDCSYVGWIYTTKKEVLESGHAIKGKRKWLKTTDRNWKKVAEEILTGEVDVYDQYLRGEVYGFTTETFDGYDWIDGDSCWGYYSKKWGSELAKEMAIEACCFKGDFMSEEDADTKAEQIAKEKAEDDLLDIVSAVLA